MQVMFLSDPNCYLSNYIEKERFCFTSFHKPLTGWNILNTRMRSYGSIADFKGSSVKGLIRFILKSSFRRTLTKIYRWSLMLVWLNFQRVMLALNILALELKRYKFERRWAARNELLAPPFRSSENPPLFWLHCPCNWKVTLWLWSSWHFDWRISIANGSQCYQIWIEPLESSL